MLEEIRYSNLDVVAQACNPSTQEAEVRDSLRARGQCVGEELKGREQRKGEARGRDLWRRFLMIFFVF